jgi:hypothetical protein
MRSFKTVLLAALGAVAVGNAVGTSTSGGGRTASKDIAVVDLTDALVGIHHVGLTAADQGRLDHLEWTTQASGMGAGEAIFSVVRESDSTVLCSATIPCTQSVSQHAHVECSAVLVASEHLEVLPSGLSTCAVMPKGVLAITFAWQ